ncbi:ribonuclease Z [Candidatus Woesearchaeota archaeon]|nr:ribonuclease Z [Candidatus Woesearchaeota archaeon]
MIEIIFLGTSSMVPTKERNQSSVLISCNTQGILVDCGEGTQRQLKHANIPLSRITKILISHWHSDHTLGLAGLIQSMGSSEYSKKLEIYGPTGTKKHMEYIFKAFLIEKRIEMEVFEIKEGKFFENQEFILESYFLEHGIKALGYNFIEKSRRKIQLKKIKKLGLPEGPLLGRLQKGKSITFKGKKINPDNVTKAIKGKKISIITDTLLCDRCYCMAKDADLLICESTYSSKLEEKSENYNHMTSKQAALIASKANVKKLVLTHFSARYKSTFELNEDARTYFDNTECAYDLMRIKLK